MKRSTSDWRCQTLGPMSVKRQMKKVGEFQEKGEEITRTTQKITNDGEDHRVTFRPFPIDQFFSRTLV